MSKELIAHDRPDADKIDLSKKVLTDDKNSHPNIIFIMACNDKITYAYQALYPEFNFSLDSYVRMSVLPSDLQSQIRKFLMSLAFPA